MSADAWLFVAGVLAMGWIFYAAIAQAKHSGLEGKIKFLEDESASLRQVSQSQIRRLEEKIKILENENATLRETCPKPPPSQTS